MTVDEVGRRYGYVWVDGQGYVKIAAAYGYAARGMYVRWDQEEEPLSKRIQYNTPQ